MAALRRYDGFQALITELERARAPYVGVNFVGLLHAGPTIIAEGTPEQRRRYLRGVDAASAKGRHGGAAAGAWSWRSASARVS